MMITIVRGGQRVMIEIIMSENDDNDGRHDMKIILNSLM